MNNNPKISIKLTALNSFLSELNNLKIRFKTIK